MRDMRETCVTQVDEREVNEVDGLSVRVPDAKIPHATIPEIRRILQPQRL